MLGNEDYVDGVIANLKIIGMVQKGGRLCVRKGQLAIERVDHSQPLRRWLAKDSRDVTLLHVRNTIQSAMKILKTLMASKEPGDLRTWTLRRLLDEMESCETGLQNLKATYMDDSMTVAAIDVLTDRLKANCEEAMHHVSESQPAKEKTDVVGDDAT
jgi:hypothetical protein